MFKKIFSHLLWRINFTSKIVMPQIVLSLFLSKRVLSGPFKGLKYINTSTGSVVLPKLIGTYEDELHPIIAQTSEQQYECFVDIGAAEGYYAVGMKKFILPNVGRTIVFEATKNGQNLINKLAKKNGLTEIEINGFCDVKALSTVLRGQRTFMIVDIEGGEFDLLCAEKINFHNCDILVEIHHDKWPGRVHEIRDKFQNTHQITSIEKRQKSIPADVRLNAFIRKYSDYMMNEFRGQQTWLFLQCKSVRAL